MAISLGIYPIFRQTHIRYMTACERGGILPTPLDFITGGSTTLDAANWALADCHSAPARAGDGKCWELQPESKDLMGISKGFKRDIAGILDAFN